VLQRFAVAYLVTGIVIVFVPTLGVKQGEDYLGQRRSMTNVQIAPEENLEETDNLLHNSHVPVPRYAFFFFFFFFFGNAPTYIHRFKSSFFPFALHWAFALTLLALWTIITFLLPVPGCPRGYIGAGGLADQSMHWNCTGNQELLSDINNPPLTYLTGGAAGYIDKIVFGETHIYGNPTCKDMYQTGSVRYFLPFPFLFFLLLILPFCLINLIPVRSRGTIGKSYIGLPVLFGSSCRTNPPSSHCPHQAHSTLGRLGSRIM
jgi:hypothetical protein